MVIDLRPNSAFFPAGETLIDTVPFAILFRQFSPLRTGAQYPVDAFYETTTFFLFTCIHIGMRSQKFVQLLPLFCGDWNGSHPNQCRTIQPYFKCQRALIRSSRPIHFFQNSEEGMRMWADGDSCPQCGWVGPADKNEVVVFRQCAACNAKWLDRQAFQKRKEILLASPWFTVRRVRDKLCTICNWQGDLRFVSYTDSNVIAVECLECDSIWLDAKVINKSNIVHPEDPWCIVPEIQCSAWNSRWATRAEIVAREGKSILRNREGFGLFRYDDQGRRKRGIPQVIGEQRSQH